MTRLIIFSILLTLSIHCFGIEEKDFWKSYSQQDFKKACETGELLGKQNVDYLFLSAICNHNMYDYDNYHQKSNYYHSVKNSDYSTLKQLLDKHYSETDFSINNLFGITKSLIPAIDIKPAQNYFEKSLSVKSQNPVAHNYLSMTYIQNGDIDKGIEFAQLAVNENKTYPEPYNNLAFGYFKKDNTSKATDILIECMKNCPKNTRSTFINYIQLSCKEVVLLVNNTMIGVPGFTKDSDREKMISALKGNNNVLLELANQFYQYNSYLEADIILDVVQPDKQTEGKYDYLRCMNLIISGDSTKYNKHLNRLVEIKEFEHILTIGNYFYENQKFNLALSTYKLAEPIANQGESKMKILSNIGTTDMQLGNYDEAIKNYLLALKINAKDDITLTNIGITYSLKGDKDKAREYLLKAKENCQSENQLQSIEHWLKEVENN